MKTSPRQARAMRSNALQQNYSLYSSVSGARRVKECEPVNEARFTLLCVHKTLVQVWEDSDREAAIRHDHAT
jgi:hypothetical protein